MYLKPTSTYGSLIPGSEYIRSLVRQGAISKDGAKRLQWFDYCERCGNARRTCRYFGISAQTFYRWKSRFDPYDLTTMKEESRRPQAVRQPQTPLGRSAALVEVTGETADEAARISFETGMPALDALILAGLIKAGCRTIYTRDEHFTRYAEKGIEIVLLD